MEYTELRQKAENLRLQLINLVHSGGTGHIGGDLSVLNVLTVLYYHTLNVDANNPKMEERDRFILSKGHCAEAYYCVLCDKGFIGQDELDQYGKDYAHLGGHPDRSIPGVELNTGALGHGLAAGVGMALAAKMQHKRYKTFVVMGDGEQAEGSIYEAAMAAHKYRLDNLVAIIDRNGLQISGSTEDVMPLESIRQRWEAFGWDVKEINGDDVRQIVNAFDNINFNSGRPHLIISDTTKGYGISYMENVAKWHHGVPNQEQYETALSEIDMRIHQLYKEGEKE
jgi:transketolase